MVEYAGGRERVYDILDRAATTTRLLEYVGILKYRSVLRQLQSASKRVGEVLGSAGGDEPGSLVAKARTILDEVLLSNPLETEEDCDRLLTTIHGLLEMETTIEHPISTGFARLDVTLAGGFRPGELVVLAARPRIGKSALALQFALTAALRGNRNVLFASLEMTTKEILMRAISQRCSIDHNLVRVSNFTQEERERIDLLRGELQQGRFHVFDARPISLDRILSKARAIKDRDGLGLVVIDYLGLLPVPGKTILSEEIGNLTHAMKAFARDEQVTVLCLAQLNRASEREERKPRLSDLRSSGDIEQDADSVLFIHRQENDAVPGGIESAAVLKIAKQRAGPVDEIELHFEGSLVRFAE
jgi:replicative DNA helicase